MSTKIDIGQDNIDNEKCSEKRIKKQFFLVDLIMLYVVILGVIYGAIICVANDDCEFFHLMFNYDVNVPYICVGDHCFG